MSFELITKTRHCCYKQTYYFLLFTSFLFTPSWWLFFSYAVLVLQFTIGFSSVLDFGFALRSDLGICLLS